MIAILGAATLVAVVFVLASLRRPTIPAWPPTPADEREAGDTLVGPVTWTVDATQSDRWTMFDFSRGSTVHGGDPMGWDLAFRRFYIIANGGQEFMGKGGIVDMGAVPFDSVRVAPETGYVETRVRSDSTNPAIQRWYDYGWISHLLTPKPNVYVVRTADGRYAKFQILGYYCPGAVPGCVTFRYVYQGDGTPKLARD